MNGETPDLSCPRPADVSLSALRHAMEGLTYECPKRNYEAGCPFQIIAGLSPTSRRCLLTELSEERLLALFDLARSCTCPADPRVVRAGATPPGAKPKM